MKALTPYFDQDGVTCYLESDDEIGLALLGRYAYWRKDFGDTFQQIREIAYFSNELAFLNCLAKWNTQGQAAGHYWVYHPTPDWSNPRQ